MDGPWKKIAEGYGKMVLGYFGKTPVAPDKKVVAIAAEQLGLKPTTESPLVLNDKNPKKSRAFFESQLKESGLPITDENVFIAASCSQKGIDFLLGKSKVSVRYNEKPKVKADSYHITVAGESFDVKLNGDVAEVNGVSYPITLGDTPPVTTAPVISNGTGKTITAGTPGLVTQVLVKEGDTVVAGQTLGVVEVMKMETQIKTPVAGRVVHAFMKKGEQVVTNQRLFEIQ